MGCDNSSQAKGATPIILSASGNLGKSAIIASNHTHTNAAATVDHTDCAICGADALVRTSSAPDPLVRLSVASKKADEGVGCGPGVRPTRAKTCEIDNPITQKHEVVHIHGWYLRKYITDARQGSGADRLFTRKENPLAAFLSRK